jgi:CRP-like cAMP-binding protein
MLTLQDTPPFLEEMEKRAKQLALSVAQALEGKGVQRKLMREAELLTSSPSSLIHILRGVFRCRHGEKTIRLYSSGDLLLSPGPGESDGLSIVSDFGAEISLVDQAVFLDALAGDRTLLSNWIAYQSLENRIGHVLCSLYIVEEVKHDPEIRQYEAGEVIIRENEDPNEVYEMIQGTASVTAKGYPLNVIKPGEVFGELSFFTGLRRTATVKALEPCLVQVIDQKQFIRIMKYRPALVDGMLRTLCQRLVSVNSKLSSGS